MEEQARDEIITKLRIAVEKIITKIKQFDTDCKRVETFVKEEVEKLSNEFTKLDIAQDQTDENWIGAIAERDRVSQWIDEHKKFHKESEMSKKSFNLKFFFMIAGVVISIVGTNIYTSVTTEPLQPETKVIYIDHTGKVIQDRQEVTNGK